MRRSNDDGIRILTDGTCCRIIAACAADGSYPAEEFIDGLSVEDKRKLQVLFEMMAEVGRITNHEKFKKVDGQIWEFKSHQIRLPCFQVSKDWVLTHGFIKKRNKWPVSELARAKRIRDEHMRRVGQ